MGRRKAKRSSTILVWVERAMADRDSRTDTRGNRRESSLQREGKSSSSTREWNRVDRGVTNYIYKRRT